LYTGSAVCVDRLRSGHRDARIGNTLTDEHGDDGRLKKGAEVEITVTGKNNCHRN